MRALTEAPMPALGDRFRTAREARGLTLSDVADHIRIRSVYLAALEEEKWSVIGAPVYIRGFMRTYARFLGLDPSEAVADFNTATGTAPPTAAEIPQPGAVAQGPSAPSQSLRPLLWIAGAVAVVLLALVVYLAVAPSPVPTPPVAAPAASLSPGASALPSTLPLAAAPGVPAAAPLPCPSATLPAAPALAASAGPAATSTPCAPISALGDSHVLTIHLTAVCWLRVTVDGSVSIEGTFPAGTTKTFHGNSAVVLVGNAGGVQIAVDGTPVGKLGGMGAVVQRTFTL